jgi:thymidine kinase
MLSIVIGPMCAGKTTKLIEDYKTFSGSKVILDFEIGKNKKLYKSHVETHDGNKEPCYKCKHLSDTHDIYNQWGNFQISHEFSTPYTCHNAPDMYNVENTIFKSNAIFINEAQFFPDLYEFVLAKLKLNKHIYIYGLDGDFQHNKMGQILDLIPHCDNIIKLKSKCLCGKDAIFTYRDSPETIQYLPNAKYIPLCRACFNNKK